MTPWWGYDPTAISGEYLPGVSRNPPTLPTPGTWRWAANWIFIAVYFPSPLWILLGLMYVSQHRP